MRSRELRDAAVFTARVLAIAAAVWAFLGITGLYPLKAFSACAASSLLNSVGVPSSCVLSGEDPVVTAGGLRAEVNDLCAGNVEIAVVVAAVLATPDRSRRNRLAGVLLGLLLVAVVNPVRIWIVLWSAFSHGLGTADLVHDLFFRATLLGTIAGYYYAWYVLGGRVFRGLAKAWKGLGK